MNFFQHQDQARKKTCLLVMLLMAAVACLILLTTLAVSGFLFFVSANSTSMNAVAYQQMSFWQKVEQTMTSEIGLWICLGVILVVVIGSFAKYLQFSRGGKSVAEALGGRRIDPSTSDYHERKVLNVVEEMAIASGNPVPPVYLMEEAGINAFAAGYTRRDAVIGITRGCAQLLGRDELQGVIAHEFSHIHNGDMRLNMRLTAILHGILLIGLLGYQLTHGARYSYSRRNSGQQLSLGLALVIIGYAGTFFGNIIKAAVSRQREFLADASAVQFTRNPQGISGALKKIGGFAPSSQLHHSKASEFSHMYFAQGVATTFQQLMATHPPLKERITRIEPRWNGQFPSVIDSAEEVSTTAETNAQVSQFASTTSFTEVQDTDVLPTENMDSITEFDNRHVARADAILASIPAVVHEACHEGFSARAVVYSLLIDKDESIRNVQLEILQKQAHPATYKQFVNIGKTVFELPRSLALTLLNLCIPALKTLSEPQFKVFQRNLVALIQADKRISLYEWCLYRITIKNIREQAAKEHYSLQHCKAALEFILSVVAQAGENDNALSAMNTGLQAIGWPEAKKNLSENLNLKTLDKAISELEQLKPLAKPKALKAIAATINAEKKVTDAEKELFRAIADSLNCPVPPL